MTINIKPSAKKRAVFELLVLTGVILPLSVQAGLFGEGMFGKKDLMVEVEPAVYTSAIDIPLLSAEQNPNPYLALGGAEVIVEDGALVSSGPVGADEIASSKVENGEISVYTVRANDTLSHIAEMYGVTVNTILWANDLTRATGIKEGQTLIILPIAGVRHVVRKGDTLASIAKQYSGDVDEIMSYNEMASKEDLVVGETLIIPGGAIHTAPVTNKGKSLASGKGVGGGWLSHPVPGAVKTQGLHGYNAIDLAASIGTSIRAAAAGEVIVSRSSGWNGGYGQYIVIRHSNGAQTLYAHLSSIGVSVGSQVTQGQVIGGMGNSGRSTGAHLHFEVRGGSNPF